MNAPMTKAEVIATGNVVALTSLLRVEFEMNKSSIPVSLKNCKGWLAWRITEINPATGKFSKIPFYPRSRQKRHGQQGSPTDMANLGTWDDAWMAFKTDKSIAGVGFALLPLFDIVALDVDGCIENGELRSDVKDLTAGTYCEISPSGKGIRAFWQGTANDGKNHEKKFELFHSIGFVTVTGNQVENFYSQCSMEDIQLLDSKLKAELEHFSRSSSKRGKPSKPELLKKAAENDPRLQAIIDAGLYERDMGGGKHSICCPFEHLHSDFGRNEGDGDTVYFQPHTNGYAEGSIYCLHTHGNDQSKYWAQIGYDINAEGFECLSSEEWPLLQPLPENLPPVPKFDLSLLPVSLRPYVEDIAERMQISADIPAIGLITALSAVIGRRVQIKPKAYDDWTVVPNLWGVVVAPPGYMKSPALSEVMRPLHRLESEAYKDYELKHAAWVVEKQSIEIKNNAIKYRLKKDPNADIEPYLLIPDEPIPTRYCVNNFSHEALGEILIGNPNGVLAYSDELYGLLKMSEKPGNEGLHDFLLSAWNGDGPFTFDRIGRGLNRRIEHVCVSILGGIQPGRLMEYITAANRGSRGDSGLIQRFQLLVWPDPSEEWRLVDRKPNDEAYEKVGRIFERLVGRELLDDLSYNYKICRIPDVRRFGPEAQDAFYAWLEQLERLLRGNNLPPVMASHLSKYRSLVPSLALIFALADDVRGAIPVCYVEQAIRWVAYLRAHAERAFSTGTHSDTPHAHALLAKIKDGAVIDGFKPADVYLKGWSLLNSEGVTKAVDLLCELGYLLRVEKRHKECGRPSITYRINPRVKN
ncbi:DUF3987 domain-containing protein [Nitrosomonas communis]|uniref:DUF3987 domain-containing protein n=1 Tax=Nitrosomonas communis TaxID=44574 RepID=A0A1I4S3Q6_9PROT|nr:DUF3987 domain-containing protein [Nitrosomonas communis]SFM59146.1 Protein of unknown function [Nitrosomonas communis]